MLVLNNYVHKKKLDRNEVLLQDHNSKFENIHGEVVASTPNLNGNPWPKFIL